MVGLSIETIAQEMVKDLTRKQQEVLDYLINFKKINKRTPTYTEIADGVGLTGKQNVYQILNYLEDKGYIEKGERGNINILKDFSFETDWLADRIRTFKDMLKEGLITEEEYHRFEKEIIEKYRQT